MGSTMNSTIVSQEQAACSMSHSPHETIIEFTARLPLERDPASPFELWLAREIDNAQVGCSPFSPWQTLAESGQRNEGQQGAFRQIHPTSPEPKSPPNLTSPSSGPLARERGWLRPLILIHQDWTDPNM